MSKRFNLREFQQNVLGRLQAEESAGAGRASMLGVQAGEERWLVGMTDINAILPPPPLTPVPLTKPWYCGVANVRGTLYGIVDFSLYRGGSAIPQDGQSRVLLIAQRYAFNVGLLVSRVLGLSSTEGWQREEKADGVQWIDDQGQMWRTLEVSQLLQQPGFLQIGA